MATHSTQTPTLPCLQPAPLSSTFSSTPAPVTGTLFTSSEKSPRHVDVWASFTKEFPDLPPEVAALILKGIYAAQQTLSEKQSVEICPTETFRYTLIVDPFGFQACPTDSSGEGGHGMVFVGLYFATKQTEFSTPIKPEPKARKKSRQKSLQNKPLFSPSKKSHFGAIHHTSTRAGHSYALMDAFSHHFGQIDWAALPHPEQHLLDIFCQTSRPLSVIHRMGHVHRDVKETNLMVKDHSFRLIDFDTARPKSEKLEYTIGTPQYLNPESFGDAASSLINQRKRLSMQTSSSGMFAYFHMGIRMTLQLCKKLIPSSDQATQDAIRSLYKPEYLTPKNDEVFSEDELREIGLNYRESHTYYTHLMFPQKVAVLPSAKTYSHILSVIIKKLPLPLASQEILLAFVSYCIEQKFARDEARVSALMVEPALKNLQSQQAMDPTTTGKKSLKRQRTETNHPESHAFRTAPAHRQSDSENKF